MVGPTVQQGTKRTKSPGLREHTWAREAKGEQRSVSQTVAHALRRNETAQGESDGGERVPQIGWAEVASLRR